MPAFSVCGLFGLETGQRTHRDYIQLSKIDSAFIFTKTLGAGILCQIKKTISSIEGVK